MNNNPFLWDIVELASHLRQEKLFVNSQQLYIQELFEKVVSKSSSLVQAAWITSQQRRNLQRLIVSTSFITPAYCCQKSHDLDSTKFIDGHKILGFQKCPNYGELLSTLRESPELVARCLVAGDKTLPEEMSSIVRNLAQGLYASCVFTQDRNLVLKVLSHLITLQLIPSEKPRRLLQQSSCAFARLYSVFHENLFPAKVYLTATLHAPVMKLLMMEETYLDIHPERKVAERFTLEERLKKFGVEGTDEYKAEIFRYKTIVMKNLIDVTLSFIDSIHENFHCFPNSVFWLAGQIYLQMKKANTIPEREVFAMCADLVFTLFICPAIVTPETYGITDVPISDVARHNLMQVAQLLQMLALRKFHAAEGVQLDDIYSHFSKDCVSSIIDTIIEGAVDGRELRLEEGTKFDNLTRLVALFTEKELNSLVSFLRTITNEVSCEDAKLQKELIPFINNFPLQTVNGHGNKTASTPPSENPLKKSSSILSKVKNKNQSAYTENGPVQDSDNFDVFKVLLIPFDVCSEPSATIQKVLAMEKSSENDRGDRRIDGDNTERQDGQEKRTRFSLSHDDGSIGNTSDNLEAVSEAPSNHSVASSLELENEDQNDNLSDMVSANVSGRGSPNISGRDTPSSQLTEGEETSSVRQPLDNNPPLPPKAVSQSKYDIDIDDKFGKFELEAIDPTAPVGNRDETTSLVSDTWSTDVLASDSETIEQQIQQSTHALHELPTLLTNPLPVTDTLDTASEAWSTDVIISDSERLTEVDTDDTASVARSDDTGRSEVESRGGDLEGVDEPVPLVGRPGSTSSRDEGSLPPPSSTNVTGKGGTSADYRRRTIEYVDTNRNHYSKQGISEEQDVLAVRKSSSSVSSPTHSASEPVFNSTALLPPTSSSKLNFRTASQQTSSQEMSLDDEREGTALSGGCFSASSSTSGSSVGPHGGPDLSSNTHLVPNGSALPENNNALRQTGVIPKSISFDKTAERGDKESMDDDGKNKRSFFKNFKLFRNRRGKSLRADCYDSVSASDFDSSPSVRIRRGLPEENRASKTDTSDDILAKYRGKGNTNETKVKDQSLQRETPRQGASEPASPCDVFQDAKKKLRLVLSNSEIHQLPDSLPLRQAWMQKENELVAFLQLQLAEAINLQDRNLVPQLYETLRCVRMLTPSQCRKVFESLKEDYKSRVQYISYLVSCQQSLLSTLAHLERLLTRINRDKQVVTEYLVSLCVRLFLGKREEQVASFVSEFQSLSLSDEKSDLLETFLATLSNDLERDPNWQCANEDQMMRARRAFERALCSRVYTHAMYPNGDGDISRDQVLQDHISKLAKVVSPDHKDLRIPKMFHCEVPWLSAQAEISEMAAYRSPRDKLQCVLRTISTILNLLSLACVPAADDVIPVLIYVIIMANPPSLLSTVEYVSSFIGNQMEGEEEYSWTQFCSAIEFIKTMDYVDIDQMPGVFKYGVTVSTEVHALPQSSSSLSTIRHHL